MNKELVVSLLVHVACELRRELLVVVNQSKLCDVSRSALADILSGRSEYRPQHVPNLAQEFRESVETLCAVYDEIQLLKPRIRHPATLDCELYRRIHVQYIEICDRAAYTLELSSS